ncbi:MAG: hypothetical protein P4L27_07970 [Ignavibacteriaceae bacterium]|nr:hypothetical protein [Ignavibacteriaceae bacterium]
MKIYKVCLIGFIIFPISPSFSQNSNKLVGKDSSYVKLLDCFHSSDEFYQKLNSMTLDELKHNDRVVFGSEDDDPLNINIAIENHHKFNLSPAYFKTRLLESIKIRQSKLDYILLKAPCLVKAKIIDIKKINYKVLGGPPGTLITLPRIDITIHIDEIFKGKGYFREKDITTFYYFPMWRPTNWNFKIGETCLLPLQPLIENNSKEVMVALVAWLDKQGSDINEINSKDGESYGRYPIIDGEIIDRANSFGVGTKVKWEKFRSLIINEINKIKSW